MSAAVRSRLIQLFRRVLGIPSPSREIWEEYRRWLESGEIDAEAIVRRSFDSME